MMDDTHLHDAIERVRNEQDRTADKQAAFEEFRAKVREVSSVCPGEVGEVSHAAGGTIGAGTVAQSQTVPGDTAGQRVRKAFVETVRQYSGQEIEEWGSLACAIREELNGDIATVLAPNTNRVFTSAVKHGVLSATTDRLHELRAMEQALQRELQSLRTATTEREAITDWISDADETPLTELGFDDLRERHETLTQHRTRCEHRLRERQELLGGRTNHDATVGIAHRTLVQHLYSEFATTHPVVTSLTRLVRICVDCQRTVRDHLTRRV